MADRAISELTVAESVGSTDLFVLEQGGVAKKLSGQTLTTWLTHMADGHGGIQTIAEYSTDGLAVTYKITYADTSVSYFTVTNGKAIASITEKWAVSSSNTTAPATWYDVPQTLTASNKYHWHYSIITFNDETTISTTKAVVGVYGDKGDSQYVHIRYSAIQPTRNADIGTAPDKWIGIYSGSSSTAPTSYTSYTWYEFKGEKGDTGTSIIGVTYRSTSGLVDTYEVSFSDGTSTTFTVENGSSIQSITKGSSSGLVDTYTVALTNGDTTTFTVTNAKSISNIVLVSGNHAAGTSDTYQINYNDGDTYTFSVYNGANGTGAVSSVSGIPVVGSSGDVPAVVIGNSAPTTATVGYVNQIYYDTTGGVLYVCVSVSSGTYQWRGAAVTVDSALSSSSTNPVQNSVIYTALSEKVPTSRTVNGKALSANITLSASDVSAVPTTRTVNGLALSTNITTRLVFTNVSVASSSWASDNTYTEFPYRAALTTSGVTTDMVPEVIFSPDDALSGDFAPVSIAGANCVYIYAASAPTATVTIPTIIVFK